MTYNAESLAYEWQWDGGVEMDVYNKTVNVIPQTNWYGTLFILWENVLEHLDARYVYCE